MKTIIFATLFLFSMNSFALEITKDECLSKGESFIFSGEECIEFRMFEGDREDSINIIVHGTWDAGTNTLGRYAPFAENINMATDITTIAVALPGYSGSSTNKLESLVHKGTKNQAARKEYIEFLGKLILSLKEKFNAKTVNYIGHSAGAMMGATLTGVKPNLINHMVAAGGRYDIHKVTPDKDLISIVDVLDTINPKTKFLLIYGTKDKISPPKVTTEFYTLAKNKKLNVQLLKVEDAEHIDLDMTDESIEAITELLDY